MRGLGALSYIRNKALSKGKRGGGKRRKVGKEGRREGGREREKEGGRDADLDRVS